MSVNGCQWKAAQVKQTGCLKTLARERNKYFGRVQNQSFSTRPLKTRGREAIEQMLPPRRHNFSFSAAVVLGPTDESHR